ncbi:MAG: hypothetical protein PVJ67_04170 [Candidatus Pacearchaeota archaeon]|jgi:hypothetical protein
MRKPIPKALRPLIRDMQFLIELVEDPRKAGSIALIKKIKGESRIPTNEYYDDLLHDIEDDIKYTHWKLRKGLGFKLPDGLK